VRWRSASLPYDATPFEREAGRQEMQLLQLTSGLLKTGIGRWVAVSIAFTQPRAAGGRHFNFNIGARTVSVTKSYLITEHGGRGAGTDATGRMQHDDHADEADMMSSPTICKIESKNRRFVKRAPPPRRPRRSITKLQSYKVTKLKRAGRRAPFQFAADGRGGRHFNRLGFQ